jgi:hypothetical protein
MPKLVMPSLTKDNFGFCNLSNLLKVTGLFRLTPTEKLRIYPFFKDFCQAFFTNSK